MKEGERNKFIDKMVGEGRDRVDVIRGLSQAENRLDKAELLIC